MAVPPPDPLNPRLNNLSTEFDDEALPIPPLDPQFFAAGNNALTEPFISDLGIGFGFDDKTDFEHTFDNIEDFELTFDDIEDFLIFDGLDPIVQNSPETGSSAASHNGAPEVAKFLNLSSPESGCYENKNKNVGTVLPGDCCDRSLQGTRVLNVPSSESGGSNREFCEPVSSRDSGNCGSGVSVGMNSQLHESGNCDRDVTSDIIVDQKAKVEDMRIKSVPKRKKEQEYFSTDSRASTYPMGVSMPNENENLQYGFSAATDDGDQKKKARLMRNRESAQLSRQRKKHYVEELEDKVKTMHSTIADLNGKISLFMAENATLRQQLSTSGMCPAPPPPPGMYPHPPLAPMAYPWVPYPPYVMKSPGSQVPLVPIPRLKPQQPSSMNKAKKSETKRSGSKSKKVSSVSFLGLLFFILLFGGLLPIVYVKYGGIRDQVHGGSLYVGNVGNRIYDKHSGRFLTDNGHLNGSDQSKCTRSPHVKSHVGNKLHCEEGHTGGLEKDIRVEEQGHLNGFINGSEPLVASLYVPRNDKLVKIDGNLIIHSFLASQQTMSSCPATETKNSKETGLAIPRDLHPSLPIPEAGRDRERHPHLFRNHAQQHKALTSGTSELKDHFKSTAADGKLTQWFREGLAGPMLSYATCTEVVHFDILPASTKGAIIPASSVTNSSAKHRQNATSTNIRMNRRTLRGLPVSFTGSDLNSTKEHLEKNSSKDGFQGNKSASSMTVSLLLDPREAGNNDADGMVAPKSPSRIFVVVLLDSIKYATYSCMLPSSGLHLVAT